MFEYRRARVRSDRGLVRAVGAVAVLTVATLLSPMLTPSASAVACVGEQQGDDFYWPDQWWVGWDGYGTTCSWHSMYVLGVQRIDIGILQQSARSGADGWYGNNTHLDVEAVQSYWGLSADELVGPTSWGYYDNYVAWRLTRSSGIQEWKIVNYNSHLSTFAWGNPGGGAVVCIEKVGYPEYSPWTRFGTNVENQLCQV